MHDIDVHLTGLCRLRADTVLIPRLQHATEGWGMGA
jgi:hypothetical protein